jgi:hypothetical protein
MNPHCDTRLAGITEQLMLGKPLTADMARHVASCLRCAREAREINEVVTTLARMSSSAAIVPNGLSLRPLPELGPRNTRRRTGRRTALLAAAAAVVAGLAIFPVVTASDDSPVTTVALTRTGYMVAHPWGTEVPVSLSGVSSGHTYNLMTEDATGRRVPAGSIRPASDGPVYTRMVTAMTRESIKVLLVEDQQDRRTVTVPIDGPFPGLPS